MTLAQTMEQQPSWPRLLLLKLLLRALSRVAGKYGPSESELAEPAPLPSPDPQVAKRALLNSLDGFAQFRDDISRVAIDVKEWAGIPMPLDGANLIVEPKYPRAQQLMAISDSPQLAEVGIKLRNTWWSDRLRGQVYIYEDEGKLAWAVDLKPHVFNHSLQVLGCAYAWGIEQEAAALQLLATLIPHHAFKHYLLTGMFLESSKRSGLTYLFRKLRPTVVVDCRDKTATSSRILCALCLHPIAYYAGSWAGAMTPTDDVVAHLMLMRGDEKLYWRRANQHGPSHPEAGL